MTEIDGQHLRLLEAILFASAEPLPIKALAERMPDGADLKVLLAELQALYANRGVNLVEAGSSWAFRTAPDLGPALARERLKVRKLGRAMIETLAIIAYHQPVTRAEVEEIRGVGFNRGTLDSLFEAGWIRPVGRRRTPGRPVTWGTTDAFLDHFGLESLADLPGLDELKAAGLLDKRPAIESYAVKGQMRAAGDTEGLVDVEEKAPNLAVVDSEPDEPLESDEPLIVDEELEPDGPLAVDREPEADEPLEFDDPLAIDDEPENDGPLMADDPFDAGDAQEDADAPLDADEMLDADDPAEAADDVKQTNEPAGA